MTSNPLLLVAIAEFDIDEGNTLSVIYPKNFDLEGRGLEKNQIADKCLPDGAHIHQEDCTFLFIDIPDVKKESSESNITKAYAMAMFKNKPDSTVRRGAIQKSMVAFTRIPIFDILQPILREGVSRYIESEQQGKKNEEILKDIYDAINNNYGQKEKIKVWDIEYSIPFKEIKEDEYPLTSITKLIKRFGVDVMYLWYSLLQEERILVTGQPASEVGEFCLTIPLLVSPIRGFRDIICPYVALTDLTKVMQPSYICGTTNSLFETKAEWYDLLVSFSTGIVKTGQFKISGSDREFIVNVINGMEKNGEEWVRTQFQNYTSSFLESLKDQKYSNASHKLISKDFAISNLYEQYKLRKKTEVSDDGETAKSAVKALDAFRSLKDNQDMSDTAKKGKLFELIQNLKDLNMINKVIDEGGVKIVVPLLDDTSSQIRKYAVQLLAQLAISMKGQIHMLQESVIPKVINMLDESMTNVAQAACSCLYRICTLYIGVYSVIKCGLHKKLFSIIINESQDIMLKKTASQTLLQIYLLKPDCEKLTGDELRELLRKNRSSQEVMKILYMLSDVWGVPIPSMPVSEPTSEKLRALRMKDFRESNNANQHSLDDDPRTIATNFLLSDMTQSPQIVMEFVAGGGVELVLTNATTSDPEEPLGRASFAVLCEIADTAIGRASLLGHKAIEKSLKAISASTSPLYTYYILRFLEVCTQHKNLAESLIKKKGMEIITELFDVYYGQTQTNVLCIPCLQSIKNVLLYHRNLLTESNLSSLNVLKERASIYKSSPAFFKRKDMMYLLDNIVLLLDPNYYKSNFDDFMNHGMDQNMLDSYDGDSIAVRRSSKNKIYNDAGEGEDDDNESDDSEETDDSESDEMGGVSREDGSLSNLPDVDSKSDEVGYIQSRTNPPQTESQRALSVVSASLIDNDDSSDDDEETEQSAAYIASLIGSSIVNPEPATEIIDTRLSKMIDSTKKRRRLSSRKWTKRGSSPSSPAQIALSTKTDQQQPPPPSPQSPSDVETESFMCTIDQVTAILLEEDAKEELLHQIWNSNNAKQTQPLNLVFDILEQEDLAVDVELKKPTPEKKATERRKSKKY
eukprot:TRINITY_DN786_c0_g2_i1.p1 TRINITY_DN786_c0_g2~~TRINITY_DN786_c0_g2_i1.p1  ORF type:complete len:1085 (+),score=296.57 TRINITY_DN786_c0_g2_i1:20-3274(+)